MREIRFTKPTLRAETQTGSRFISGHAAVFGRPADIGGQFLEQIRQGAFARAIREKQNVCALLNHNPDSVLGRVSNRTLELREDADGLFFRCDVAPTATGDEVLAMVRRGDIGECSFGFSVPKGGEEWAAVDVGGKRRDLRTLVDVDLFDVSPVCYPAYDGTGVSVERSRLASMFPAGAPASAPMELRGRIAAAIQISTSEYLERLWARNQANRLMGPVEADHGNAARLASLAALMKSL